MAKKIYQLDKELLMTAEEILFLERIFTLKQIFELSINDPDKKRGLLKILSRSICVSQAMEK
jgi:hypothetical protein